MNHEMLDILSIAKQASQHKKQDPKVINASLGVLLDEEGAFITLKSVDEALVDVSQTTLRKYMPQDGGELYKRSIYQYLFKSHLDNLNKNFFLTSNWASGGSGALNIAFHRHQGIIMVPHIRWHEYDQIAKNVGKSVKTYPHFDEDAFEAIEEAFKDNDEPILFILNDPAHNPTGYSLSTDEYERLFQLLQMYKHVSLLIDIAYVDFSHDYFNRLIPLLITYKQPLYFAFSGSKSFLAYGIRMGALIYLSSSLEEKIAFEQEARFIVGAQEGAPNSLSVLLLSEIIHKSQLSNEQNTLKALLEKRSARFIELAEEKGVSIYPYKEGFFMTIKTDNPFTLSERLTQEKVYVIPTYKGIRIAISAISIEEIERLFGIIEKL